MDTYSHPEKALKSIDFISLSNIKVWLSILGTTPVTTCTCERSFSSNRWLETYTRWTMISERLSGIALMHVHQEIVPDKEKVIDLFAVTNRRFNFIWFLLVSNQYIIFAFKIIKCQVIQKFKSSAFMFYSLFWYIPWFFCHHS